MSMKFIYIIDQSQETKQESDETKFFKNVEDFAHASNSLIFRTVDSMTHQLHEQLSTPPSCHLLPAREETARATSNPPASRCCSAAGWLLTSQVCARPNCYLPIHCAHKGGI